MQAGLSHKLLSIVYAAASDASKWQAVCDEINLATEVPLMMFGHNLGTDACLGIIASGLDPVEMDRYHSHFADKNPWMHMNAIMPTGMVGVSDQALDRDALFRTEFYNDWLRAQENVVAGPFMMCHRSGNSFVGMAAACRARRVDETLPKSQYVFEALAPHLRHAIALNAALCDGQGASFTHLDANRHAIVLLRRSGQVAFVNRAAKKLFTDFSNLRVDACERLSCVDPVLGRFVEQSVRAIDAQDFDGLPKPLLVRMSEDQQCMFYGHLFPSDVEPVFPQSAWSDCIGGAIVVAGCAGISRDADCAQMARALGATPAEAKLAAAMMAGITQYEFADENGLSRHTVRNQMRALLQKTGTGNQTDCLRHLSNLTSPFTFN